MKSPNAIRSPFWKRRFGSHCMRVLDRRIEWDCEGFEPTPNSSKGSDFGRKRVGETNISSSCPSLVSDTSSHSPLMYPMIARYVRFINVICATNKIAVTSTREVAINRVAKSSPIRVSKELVKNEALLPNRLPASPVTPDGPQSNGPCSQCSVMRHTISVCGRIAHRRIFSRIRMTAIL